MKLGQIENFKITGCYYAGTRVPKEYKLNGSGNCAFGWDDVYDVPVDVEISFGEEWFVGAIDLNLCGGVKKLEVYNKGEKVAVHSGESGKTVGGYMVIPVSVYASALTIRFYPALLAVDFHTLRFLGAKEDTVPTVWPTLRSIEYQDDTVKIKDISASGDDIDELYAAKFLKEQLLEYYGGSIFAQDGVSVVFKKESYEGERYTVAYNDGKFVLSAATRLTLLFAAETLRQTASPEGVRIFNCDDAPQKQLRGIHIGLPRRDRFEFLQRLMKYVILPLRYNTVFMEFAGGMRFDRHPEIAEAYLDAVKKAEAGLQPPFPHAGLASDGTVLEKEDVKELVAGIKELGFEFIPEVQSLGHVQYITNAHPEIAEIEEKEVVVTDTRNEDTRPASFYHHCYCPSNEESYRIIFDIIDEIVEVSQPNTYVHIGHDEVYDIGICKKCRQRGAAVMYAEHVTRLHDYLAEKYGLKTVIWSDMIHKNPTIAYETAAAINMLPKDILMLDFIWYFHIGADIEDELLPEGYTLAYGNLYSSHFPRYESRIAKENVIGGQVSTWAVTSEEKFVLNGKMWDFMYLAEMLWNSDIYDSKNRRGYNELLIKHVQPTMRDALHNKLAPHGWKEKSFEIPEGKETLPCEISELDPNAILCKDSVKVDLCGTYERLYIEHATLLRAPCVAWEFGKTVGEYTLAYEDGSTVSIPVRYATEVLSTDFVYGEPMNGGAWCYYRHTGYVGTWVIEPTKRAKAKDGSDVAFTRFCFENPHPEKALKSITYTPEKDDYCGLVLASICGANRI